MDQLKRSRRPLRGQLARKIQELNDKLRRPTPDRDTVKVKLEMLQKIFEKLQAMDDNVSRLLVEEGTDEQQDQEMVAMEDYEEQYRVTKI